MKKLMAILFVGLLIMNNAVYCMIWRVADVALVSASSLAGGAVGAATGCGLGVLVNSESGSPEQKFDIHKLVAGSASIGSSLAGSAMGGYLGAVREISIIKGEKITIDNFFLSDLIRRQLAIRVSEQAAKGAFRGGAVGLGISGVCCLAGYLSGAHKTVELK